MRRHRKPISPEKVENGDELRSVPTAEPEPQGSVLLATQPGEAPRDASIGVFGPGAEVTPVTPPGRRDVDSTDASLTELLKTILREDAIAAFQDDPARRLTNLEVLARGMVNDALGGDRTMREMVVERVEGKAIRAAQVTPADSSLEDQLDRASIAALNDLAKE
jgi:hypothetical protein